MPPVRRGQQGDRKSAARRRVKTFAPQITARAGERRDAFHTDQDPIRQEPGIFVRQQVETAQGVRWQGQRLVAQSDRAVWPRVPGNIRIGSRKSHQDISAVWEILAQRPPVRVCDRAAPGCTLRLVAVVDTDREQRPPVEGSHLVWAEEECLGGAHLCPGVLG